MHGTSANDPQARRGDHLPRTTRLVVAKTSAHDRSAWTYNIQGESYADVYAVDELDRPGNSRD